MKLILIFYFVNFRALEQLRKVILKMRADQVKNKRGKKLKILS